MTMDITARFEPDIDAESEAEQRRTRLAVQVAAVRRRSKFIRGLRFWLPTGIVVLALLNVGWITVQSILSSLNMFGGTGSEIRMTNPRFFGQSNGGAHYTVSGLEAIRKTRDAPTVYLKSPNMDYKGDSDGASHVSATNGVYSQTTQLFTLTGNVIMMPGGSDFTFKTESAVVDLSRSIITGDQPITGTGAEGSMSGQSFAITDNGRNIVFKGRGDNQVEGTKLGSAIAQATSGRVGTVHVQGDQWHADQDARTEFFDGRVTIIQDDGNLKADHVKILHAPGPDGKGWGDVSTMEATGNILYVATDKTVKGDNAVYTRATDTMVVTGAVTLTQGQNVMTGNRLVSQVKNGLTTMDANPTAAGVGRVHSTFYPNKTPVPATVKPAPAPASR